MGFFFAAALSGLLATGVMILVLYLPTLWGGLHYDTLGGLGSMLLRRVDARARVVGAILLLLGGVAFAFFYGLFVQMFQGGPFPAPLYLIPGGPTQINLFFPLFGLVAGFCHGIFIGIITTFVVVDYHPVPSYREVFPLLVSFIIGHTVYGVVVTFFLSQFLQLLT